MTAWGKCWRTCARRSTTRIVVNPKTGTIANVNALVKGADTGTPKGCTGSDELCADSTLEYPSGTDGSDHRGGRNPCLSPGTCPDVALRSTDESPLNDHALFPAAECGDDCSHNFLQSQALLPVSTPLNKALTLAPPGGVHGFRPARPVPQTCACPCPWT